MATVLPLGRAWIADILSQASLRDVQRQRCWKRGSGDGQRLRVWDYGTTWAIFQCRWQARFDAHLNRPARPSAAADIEERQICTTCLFAESVGLCLCFSIVRHVQRQRCWKRGSGDGQRLSLYDFDTTERSFNAVGEVRLSPEQSARQPIARSGKFVRRAYSRKALDCEKTTVLWFLPSWSTLLFERGFGEEGRFDVAARSETPKTSCQNHKRRLLRPAQRPK